MHIILIIFIVAIFIISNIFSYWRGALKGIQDEHEMVMKIIGELDKE